MTAQPTAVADRGRSPKDPAGAAACAGPWSRRRGNARATTADARHARCRPPGPASARWDQRSSKPANACAQPRLESSVAAGPVSTSGAAVALRETRTPAVLGVQAARGEVLRQLLQ